VKSRIYNFRPQVKAYYRITFNLLSLVLFIPIVFVFVNLRTEWVFQPTLVAQIGGVIFILAGLYIIKDSFKKYRTDEFLGLYQIEKKQDYQPTTFNREGWNNVVRHPLYLGTIISVAGLFILLPSEKMALSAFLIFCYTLIGTVWEEKKLVDTFGDDYIKYQEDVSMLFPFRWLKQKIFS
jgi:protein-S-isoprenylcysteine O-methyltransferase Ste14